MVKWCGVPLGGGGFVTVGRDSINGGRGKEKGSDGSSSLTEFVPGCTSDSAPWARL